LENTDQSKEFDLARPPEVNYRECTLIYVLSAASMKAAKESHQQARAAEREASAALIEAEETLQRLVRSHRPGSSTVDHAVTELANRLNAYTQAREGSVQADTAYHEQHLQEVLQDRHRRWADHDERIQADRHPTVPVQQVQAGECDVQQHPVPSRGDEGQPSSGGSDHDEGANEANAMVPQAEGSDDAGEAGDDEQASGVESGAAGGEYQWFGEESDAADEDEASI